MEAWLELYNDRKYTSKIIQDYLKINVLFCSSECPNLNSIEDFLNG